MTKNPDHQSCSCCTCQCEGCKDCRQPTKWTVALSGVTGTDQCDCQEVNSTTTATYIAVRSEELEPEGCFFFGVPTPPCNVAYEMGGVQVWKNGDEYTLLYNAVAYNGAFDVTFSQTFDEPIDCYGGHTLSVTSYATYGEPLCDLSNASVTITGAQE